MSCENNKKLITDMLAGELPEQEKYDLEKHLASCEICRNELDEQKAAWSMIETALTSENFDTSLGKERHEKISIAQTKFSVVHFTDLVRKFVWLELAAGFVICTAIAFMILPSIKEFKGSIRKGKAQEPFPAADAVPGQPKPKQDLGKSAAPLPEKKSAEEVPNARRKADDGKLPPAPSKMIVRLEEKSAVDSDRTNSSQTDFLVKSAPVKVPMNAAELGNDLKSAASKDVTSGKEIETLDEKPDLRAQGGARKVMTDKALPDETQKKYKKAEGTKTDLAGGGFGAAQNKGMEAELPSKTYQLDLKAIGVSDENSFRDYLKKNGVMLAETSTVRINIEKNTVTITAPEHTIAAADIFLIKTAKAKIHGTSSPAAPEAGTSKSSK